MASYKRFEELPVWQKSRVLAKEIDALVHSCAIQKNFKLKDQMLGSSGSIMDNIAEGFERSGNGEFSLFLFYSKGSAGELRSQLYRAYDCNYISKEDFETFRNKCEGISQELQNFTDYLRRTDKRGPKFTNRAPES